MNVMKNMPISFPGLFGEWEFNPDPIAIHVGHGVYWYGIILACAMLAGLFLAMKQSKRYGIREDDIMDLVLWAVPCCIIGSRIYYVLFNLDFYRRADGSLDWGAMVRLWDGGLAIYGTVIVGVLVLLVFAKVRKLKFSALTDIGVLGLILGQCIGRWANFINREAFGGLTDLPWRMRLWVSQTSYIEVHPTFLYESLWNLVGLLLLLFVVSRGRRFDGENTWFYFLWYGLGRSWIEGLRTDSLYLFDWTFLGERIRVSQALSLVMAIVAVAALIYELKVKKRTADGLLVNQLAAAEAARAAQETETAEPALTVTEIETEVEAAAALAAEEVAESVSPEKSAETAEEIPTEEESYGNEN